MSAHIRIIHRFLILTELILKPLLCILQRVNPLPLLVGAAFSRDIRQILILIAAVPPGRDSSKSRSHVLNT